MLLRLLPTPSPAQPSPPTILFTLPLPSSPYTSRALPLPPNLLAHRSLCLQEDIDCANVLLGDKASWISGIVDNVTFSLPHSTIVVHLVDGSTVNVDLGDDCIALLHRVVAEVQLSFAAAAAPPAPAPPSPAQAETPRSNAGSDNSSLSSYSQQSTASSTSRTSSILYSILQPLLPTPAPAQSTAPQIQPARAHRRLARSLLVDAYRRHVLPVLKGCLPSAYLLWAIQSETGAKVDEYNGIREDINRVLVASGVDISSIQDQQPQGYQSSSPTSYSPVSSRSSTPRSSMDSVSSSHNHAVDMPPAHTLPAKQRVTYSAQINRLTQVASRISSITKLATRYEREEGKRKWLEQLDLNRDGDKALRRAFSNGMLPATATLSSAPTRASCLRNGVTAGDLEVQARRIACQAAASANAALEDILEATSDEDDISEPDLSDSRSSASASPEPLPRTPTTDRTSAFSDDEDIPLSPTPASHKSFEDAPVLIPGEWDESDLCPPMGIDDMKRMPLPPLPAQPQWR